MSDLKENLTYEQPKLTKHGTMKSLTLGAAGSGMDAQNTTSDAPSPNGTPQDGGPDTGSDPIDTPNDAHDGGGNSDRFSR